MSKFRTVSKNGAAHDNVKLVRTQGWQLWLNRTIQSMGFVLPPNYIGRHLFCSFLEPFDTWCDMTHLIARERFEPPPEQLAYFCNVAPNDPKPAPFSDPGYPETERNKMLAVANRFLDTGAKFFWPDGMDQTNPSQFDRTQIVSQFFRLNLDPSEQYVLSVKGSGNFRLAPGDSGFENLFLAGDWTQCILDLGCVEAAVISGKLAAAAIAASAPEILGLIGAAVEKIPAVKRRN